LLHETHEEPTLPTLRDKAQNEIKAILKKYPTKRSAVLPLCHLAQKEYGYMSAAATREVAAILDLDPTEVQSLVGFYSLLRENRPGQYVIEVCDDLPCALRGADRFVDHVCERLGVLPGETTDDGVFTLETVMCVAACDRAPVAQINQEYYENLDPDKFDAVLEQLRNRVKRTAETTDADSIAGN
jgi:NADH-quinone oxidoreductase subunit E